MADANTLEDDSAGQGKALCVWASNRAHRLGWSSYSCCGLLAFSSPISCWPLLPGLPRFGTPLVPGPFSGESLNYPTTSSNLPPSTSLPTNRPVVFVSNFLSFPLPLSFLLFICIPIFYIQLIKIPYSLQLSTEKVLAQSLERTALLQTQHTHPLHRPLRVSVFHFRVFLLSAFVLVLLLQNFRDVDRSGRQEFVFICQW